MVSIHRRETWWAGELLLGETSEMRIEQVHSGYALQCPESILLYVENRKKEYVVSDKEGTNIVLRSHDHVRADEGRGYARRKKDSRIFSGLISVCTRSHSSWRYWSPSKICFAITLTKALGTPFFLFRSIRAKRFSPRGSKTMQT